MRSISALDVRARFGQVLDEAAAGERFVVERAGQPVAAIVPLRDLDAIDPDLIRARRLAALDQLVRLRSRRQPLAPDSDVIVTRTSIERDRRDGPTGNAGRVEEITSATATEPDPRDRLANREGRVSPTVTGFGTARDRRDRRPDRDERTDQVAPEVAEERDRRDHTTDAAAAGDRGRPADKGWRQW